MSIPTDDVDLGGSARPGADELPRVYAQAEAYAEELHRLYIERQATEAELARKVLELERSHEQLLAYATDLGALELAAEGDVPPDPRSARAGGRSA